jgi:hypothetical protein
MAKAVDHGIISGAATTGWETVKTGVGGGFWGGVVGAIIGAFTVVSASIVTVIPAITIAAVGVAGAALASASAGVALASASMGLGILAAFGLVAAAGAVAGGISGATVGSVGGGFLGVFKGASRVSREKAQYVAKEGIRDFSDTAKLQYAAEVGRQQGAQEGAAMTAELYNKRMAELSQKMGPAQQKSFTAAIDAERNAAANAGKQI